jgi:hypothetical protein
MIQETSMAIQYQIIYWRDIPTHLRLRQGRTRHTHALPEIFQKTVYRAAYRAKAITGDAYQDSWRAEGWVALEHEIGEEPGARRALKEAGLRLAQEIIAAYDEERLNALALGKGYEAAS